MPAPLARNDRTAAGELLVLADHVRLLEFDPRDSDACSSADGQVVDTCHSVVAVWDGSLYTAREDAAHLVADARSQSLPVDGMPRF